MALKALDQRMANSPSLADSHPTAGMSRSANQPIEGSSADHKKSASEESGKAGPDN